MSKQRLALLLAYAQKPEVVPIARVGVPSVYGSLGLKRAA